MNKIVIEAVASSMKSDLYKNKSISNTKTLTVGTIKKGFRVEHCNTSIKFNLGNKLNEFRNINKAILKLYINKIYYERRKYGNNINIYINNDEFIGNNENVKEKNVYNKLIFNTIVTKNMQDKYIYLDLTQVVKDLNKKNIKAKDITISTSKTEHSSYIVIDSAFGKFKPSLEIYGCNYCNDMRCDDLNCPRNIYGVLEYLHIGHNYPLMLNKNEKLKFNNKRLKNILVNNEQNKLIVEMEGMYVITWKIKKRFIKNFNLNSLNLAVSINNAEEVCEITELKCDNNDVITASDITYLQRGDELSLINIGLEKITLIDNNRNLEKNRALVRLSLVKI